ncbi:hypothetical protein WMY93_012726 [Mugilogobius chulae]|uniref:XK-related protein n=1 Tax=Mugilogobius chulae TaxID=88201 RepID=A0AAW0NXG9_9GOBI
MSTSDFQYTKLRWVMTVAALCLYAADIWTDICLTMKFYQEKHYLWAGLTLGFIVAGLLVNQIFSYVWYHDDMNDFLINPNGKTTKAGLSKGGLGVLHLCGLGVFTRYYQLLKKGFVVLWSTTQSLTEEESRQKHHDLFCMATDLSMLKLFETFLESVPQLLLQVYIVLLGQREPSVLQYLSMTFSFLSTAWSLVDYRRCLRRSLPHINSLLKPRVHLRAPSLYQRKYPSSPLHTHTYPIPCQIPTQINPSGDIIVSGLKYSDRDRRAPGSSQTKQDRIEMTAYSDFPFPPLDGSKRTRSLLTVQRLQAPGPGLAVFLRPQSERGPPDTHRHLIRIIALFTTWR